MKLPWRLRIATSQWDDHGVRRAGDLPHGAVPRPARRGPRPADLEALRRHRDVAALVAEGNPTGLPLLRRAVTAYRTDEITAEEELGWLPLVCRMAHDPREFDTWSVLSARFVDLARDADALSVLPSALLLRVSNRVYTGDLAAAGLRASEAAVLGEATGSGVFAHSGSAGRRSTTRWAALQSSRQPRTGHRHARQQRPL
ncbi:MAG: hypothetical protein ABI692_00355 [Terracoccus sp.]